MAAPHPDAPAVLKLHPNGTAVLEIQDHDAEVLDYSPEPAAVRPDADGVTREAWAVTLRRLDGGAGPYRVSRTHAGRMRCDCPDTTFGRAKRELRLCKHRYSCANVMAFAQRITSMARKKDEHQPSPSLPADQPAEAAPAEGQAELQAPPRDGQIAAIAQALAAPFDEREVKWKPQTVTGNRALMIPFVDARVIQDRLDDVLGVMNWQDSYEVLPDGAVVCRLKLRIAGEWIVKEDVGGMSEQPDEGDKRKASFSDALKRAAVKYGLGRYLYRQPPQWVDYDVQKRRPVRPPVLAAPAPAAAASGPRAQALARTEAARAERYDRPAAPEARSAPAPSFNEELKARDAALARDGLAAAGELRRHVKGQIDLAGPGADRAAVARAAADDFEARARRPKAG